jgi:hypothetical protein
MMPIQITTMIMNNGMVLSLILGGVPAETNSPFSLLLLILIIFPAAVVLSGSNREVW